MRKFFAFPSKSEYLFAYVKKISYSLFSSFRAVFLLLDSFRAHANVIYIIFSLSPFYKEFALLTAVLIIFVG